MARRLHVFLALCLVADAFAVPVYVRQPSYVDNEVDAEKRDLDQAASEITRLTREAEKESAPSIMDDDDDEDFDEPAPPSSGGGSNIFSLLKIASALFPGSSSGNVRVRKLIREFLKRYQSMTLKLTRRQDVADNEIELDYDLKPPTFQNQTFQRQETEEESDNTESESSNGSQESTENDEDEDNGNDNDDIDNNAAEESVEENDNKNNDKQELSESNGSNSDDDDDEPPEGDEQGGGILGLLAGLSGGEDGQSDLGSLLAAVGGIVANLSGDGIDLNALIASALGLFVGLLSEGEENPGAVIASYLLTSLETITGGGSNNNGAFFGTFLSKLIKGISAAVDPDADSEEEGNEGMKDSAGFFGSLLMALLGEMSKGSSGGSSSHPWRRSFFWS